MEPFENRPRVPSGAQTQSVPTISLPELRGALDGWKAEIDLRLGQKTKKGQTSLLEPKNLLKLSPSSTTTTNYPNNKTRRIALFWQVESCRTIAAKPIIRPYCPSSCPFVSCPILGDKKKSCKKRRRSRYYFGFQKNTLWWVGKKGRT